MSAPAALTLTSAFCRVLTDYLSARGQPLGAVLDALGVDEAGLSDSDRRIPRLRFNAALDTAMTQTRDACMGLHVGEQIRPGHYGVLGYVMMSCDTSRQLVERHQKWHPLVAQGATIAYEETPELLRLHEVLPPLPGLLSRAGVECQAAATLTFARWVFGRQFRPVEVCFPYARPADLAEYQRIFECPLVFNAPEFSLAIHNGMLDLPLPQADPELRQVMEAKATRQAAELGIAEDPLLEQLRRGISRLLPQALPDIEKAAVVLNMSSRTLQRRLEQRGTHFKAVLDTVRRDLALGYVRDPSLTLADIAFLLAFSQQSAFNRAFRRWTAATPGTYRRKLAK